MQGVVGNIASVAMGADGTVWVLSRGGRVWGEGSFDTSNRITHKEPIQSNVVMQLHPDTGAGGELGLWLSAEGHGSAVAFKSLG